MFDVELEFQLPAVPEVVFDHFTRIELLTTWWPTDGHTDPHEGGEYMLHWDGPDVTLRGRYLVVERPNRLQFTWSWDHDDDDSVVTVELMSVGGATTARIRQTASSSDEQSGYVDGWTYFIDRLVGQLAG